MNDLNTIARLNRQAHERAVSDWRNDGKYVVTVYDGLHLVVAEPHETAEAATLSLDKVRATGTTAAVLPPFPPERRISRHRDQSEDRGVSFASVEEYLAHTRQV